MIQEADVHGCVQVYITLAALVQPSEMQDTKAVCTRDIQVGIQEVGTPI